MNVKLQAKAELAKRELEKRFKPQRDDLVEFIEYFFTKEKNQSFQKNWHHELIAEKLNKVLTGEITRLIINIPPGHMKCLHPETEVLTPTGPIRIADLDSGDLVYAERNKELVVQAVVAKEIAQKKRSVRVKTKTGRELIMSHDHPMLTFAGYVQGQDLKEGDFLCCLNTEIASGKLVDDDELTYIAHMIFEGGCSGRTITYSNNDPLVVADFMDACKRLDVQVKQYPSNAKWDYNILGGKKGKGEKLLKKYGILGHQCYTKRLPKEFFAMPLKQRYRFIGIMFATDGTFAKQAENACISLANEKLIDDIQKLLSTCGVISSKSFSKNKHAGAWSLTIGASQLHKVYENCNLLHKKEQCKALLGKLRYSQHNVYPNAMLKGLNGYKARKCGQRIGNKKNVTPERFERLVEIFPELERHRNKDFFWDKIVSIEDAGVQDLVHIQVTGEKNFLANGLVSHNTELVTKCFPVWALGKRPELQIIATGYSTNLTQTYSNEARDYYTSDAYKTVFPRRPELRDDQNTKEWWVNEKGGFYYATGTGGSITGRRCNIFIIDDPIKPDEAESDVKRKGINNWYENTVLSRLYSPVKDAVIIIQQRTHEDDLCGHLLEKMKEGTGEDWETVILPAIATKDDEFRQEGEALHVERYPLEALDALRKSLGNVNFSTQYQQNPIAKESQEFHEEWFKYYQDAPIKGRVFTCVDPAFSKKTTADYTAIVTAKFFEDKMYILEITHGKYDPAELEEKILYHARKWEPEKIGVEAVGAQRMIGFSLKNRITSERLRTSVEDIAQRGDKETKIRRLIPLYRNGLIYHKAESCGELEQQALKFPRGAHDDIVDAVQMLYDMYELQPNTKSMYSKPKVKFSKFGKPIIT